MATASITLTGKGLHKLGRTLPSVEISLNPGLLFALRRERRFVLSYFCADDTLSVFEPPVPNSGIMGGKYLERSKAPKPQTVAGTYYREQDLFAGARITLAGKVFELLEADKFTQDFKSRV